MLAIEKEYIVSYVYKNISVICRRNSVGSPDSSIVVSTADELKKINALYFWIVTHSSSTSCIS